MCLFKMYVRQKIMILFSLSLKSDPPGHSAAWEEDDQKTRRTISVGDFRTEPSRRSRSREATSRRNFRPSDAYDESRRCTTITAAHETTCAKPGLTSHLRHHRGAEIIVTARAFHYGRVQYHAKKEAAIVAKMTVCAISTTIAAIEDRKSDSNEYHAVTSAKPRAISRLPGGSTSLDMA